MDDGLTGGDWLRAGAVVVGALIVAVVVARVLRLLITRSVGSRFAAMVVARLVSYAVFVVGLVYALNTLGLHVGPMLGALGLTGLVLALALQNVVENFVASLILQARRPYTLGDLVRLGDHVGKVADIDARTTVLDAVDGTLVRIPNATVLREPIVNLTANPSRRSRLDVGVAYDTDLDAATRELVAAAGRVPRVRTEPAPMVVLTGFGASSIDFAVYFWHDSDLPSEFAARHDLVVAVHHGLEAAGIVIAFPQVVVWSGTTSGSPYSAVPGEVYGTHVTAGPAPDGPRRPITWPLTRRRGDR